MNMYVIDADCDADPAFEKLLSDNRERYIQQSRNTRCGQVAPLPPRDHEAERPARPTQLMRYRVPRENASMISDSWYWRASHL